MKHLKVFIKYFDLLRTISAILIGLGISIFFLILVSKNPGNAILTFILGPFSKIRRFLNLLEFMTPIMLTSLGMCMMLQVGEFNLIGDGIFFFSAAVITFLSCKLLPANIPIIIYPIILIMVAILIGGCIASVPAYLKAKWKTNEVVISLMLNYVLVLAGSYILMHIMRDYSVTYPASFKIAENAKLHTLIPRSEVDTGLIIAIFLILIIYWFLNKTKTGFEIRMTGSNKLFAEYIGISTIKSKMIAQLIGGSIAGLAGCLELLGKYDRFMWTASLGYGFDGLMVAVIAKKNPALVPIAAFFLAYIRIGSDIVGSTTDVPLQFVQVVQGIIIIMVAAVMLLDSFRQKAVIKLSKAEMEAK